MGTSPAIVYITEVARPDLRGSLISSAPTLASLGKNKKRYCEIDCFHRIIQNDLRRDTYEFSQD